MLKIDVQPRSPHRRFKQLFDPTRTILIDLSVNGFMMEGLHLHVLVHGLCIKGSWTGGDGWSSAVAGGDAMLSPLLRSSRRWPWRDLSTAVTGDPLLVLLVALDASCLHGFIFLLLAAMLNIFLRLDELKILVVRLLIFAIFIFLSLLITLIITLFITLLLIFLILILFILLLLLFLIILLLFLLSISFHFCEGNTVTLISIIAFTTSEGNTFLIFLILLLILLWFLLLIILLFFLLSISFHFCEGSTVTLISIIAFTTSESNTF